MLLPYHHMELMSIAMTTAVCAGAKCNWSMRTQDFGTDLSIHGERWVVQPQIDVQLKSTRIASPSLFDNATFNYPLRLKNYNDLIRPTICPRILLLALLPLSEDEWLIDKFDSFSFNYGIYWASLRGMPPTKNRQSVSVTFSLANRFNVQTLVAMMDQLDRRGEIQL